MHSASSPLLLFSSSPLLSPPPLPIPFPSVHLACFCPVILPASFLLNFDITLLEFAMPDSRRSADLSPENRMAAFSLGVHLHTNTLRGAGPRAQPCQPSFHLHAEPWMGSHGVRLFTSSGSVCWQGRPAWLLPPSLRESSKRRWCLVRCFAEDEADFVRSLARSIN